MLMEKYSQVPEKVIELLEEEYNKCPEETPVSCVIVSKKQEILSHTHNRFPLGLSVTEERLNNETKSNYTLHAEALAVFHALRNRPAKELIGATVYVKGKCVCHNCANLLIEMGVSKVLCPVPDVESRWVDSNRVAIMNLSEANVTIELGHRVLDPRDGKTEEEKLLSLKRLGTYLQEEGSKGNKIKVSL